MVFFWGGGWGRDVVCLCVCFTDRALICISNSVFVATGEDSLYCADSKSTQYCPAMYDLTQGGDVTHRVCSSLGHYRASVTATL